jgi:hypothetical protein
MPVEILVMELEALTTQTTAAQAYKDTCVLPLISLEIWFLVIEMEDSIQDQVSHSQLTLTPLTVAEVVATLK